MIYPRYKDALQAGRASLRSGAGLMMIDGDHYGFDPRHEMLSDVPDRAMLGKPVRLENIRSEMGVVRADPVEFDAIKEHVPDYLLMFLMTGELVVLLDQLDWSERRIDGRPLAIKWSSMGIFSL